jgi:predicted HicB family RNase H-like nuclease
MPYGEVGRKATNKYRSKYSMLQVRVEPAEKEAITQHAKERGESLNQCINRAIQETMERDKNILKPKSCE